MKKLWLTFTFAALTLSGATISNGQVKPAASGGAAARAAQQQHLLGEVTAVDQTTGQITVKTDSGSSVTVAVNDQTLYRRIPPGQTSLENAERITRADVSVGDRILVPNGAQTGVQATARQVIVMAREAVAARREQEREDWRARGANGRVVAIDPAKKEITVEARSRQGAQTIAVIASGDVRFRRYASGSLRPADAIPGSFADIRVGDQIRARGSRDGSRLTAEEIISGTVARLTGVVEAVDVSRGEVMVRDSQSGRTLTVVLGTNVTLRRIPAEYAETLRQRREQRREGAGAAAEGRTGERAGRRRREGGPEGERQRTGGRGPQQMFENMPAIPIAELKKGDALLVMGTTGTDASRVTAATLITGDPELIQRLQRSQRGAGRSENMSPGLPGGVVGGGTGDRDQP